jgi:subtilisin family serine protease
VGKTVNVSKALLQREREALASGGPGRNVSVIVRFEGEPLSSYRGTIAGMDATTPALTGGKRLDARSANSQRYLSYLNARHQAFASQMRNTLPAARVTHSFKAAMNGMAVVVPEGRISALASLPGVAAVYEDKLLQLNTDASPAFIGAPALWNKLGGQGKAGEGVVVGVLDSGVWPEHPSLADPDPSGKPYAPPPGAARACEFAGGANPGPAFACNNKLIGGRRFMATYDAVIGLLPGEFTSARDDDGHGTHTTTTAAGNRNVSASIYGRPLGIVSGIAPRAHVMMYRSAVSRVASRATPWPPSTRPSWMASTSSISRSAAAPSRTPIQSRWPSSTPTRLGSSSPHRPATPARRPTRSITASRG